MGTQSNGKCGLCLTLGPNHCEGNPFCKQNLVIQNPKTGLKVAATVGDKCMGCTGYSIDLTDALFKAVGNGCDGRCPGFSWWFVN